MITPISKQEKKRIEHWQSHGTSAIQYLLFTGKDGKEYKCDQVNPTGLKEIRAFQRQLKKTIADRQSLLDLQNLLL